MRSLFVGHGSPVTAFTENRFQKTWNDIPGWLKKRPKAIVVLSAHWLTSGVFLTGDDEPKTIHDFRGFPNEYYQFNYPAKGANSLCDQLVAAIPDVQVSFDWGFDHGTWAILKHVFPEAEVPVVQMSINIGYSMAEHVELAHQIQAELDDEVLFIGSGNTVHNLERRKAEQDAEAFCWAQEFDQQVIKAVESADISRLIELPTDRSVGGPCAAPSLDHYLPLLYVAAMNQEKKPVKFFNNEIIFGSISMLSYLNS